MTCLPPPSGAMVEQWRTGVCVLTSLNVDFCVQEDSDVNHHAMAVLQLQYMLLGNKGLQNKNATCPCTDH